MKNKPYSIGSVLVILMFLLTSCSGITTKPEEALWGKWDFLTSDNGNSAYSYNLAFEEDGTLSIIDESSSKVNFVVIAPGRLKITHNGATLILQYELSEERLSLVFDTGSTSYQRSTSSSEVSVAFTQEALTAKDVSEVAQTSDDLPQITPTQTITIQPQPSNYFLSLPEPVKVRNTSKGTIEMFSNPQGSHMLEQDGVLWMGGWEGITAWDMATGSFKHYTVLDGLITNSISSMALTPSNEVLVDCYDGGMSIFTGNGWETFESHRLDTILTITDDGAIWATDPGRRLLGRYEDGQWELYESWGDLVEGAVGIGTVIPTTDNGMLISTRNVNDDPIILQYQNRQWRIYTQGLTKGMYLIADHNEDMAWLFNRESHELGLYDGYEFKGLIDLSKHFEGDRFFINSAHYDTISNSLFFAVAKFDQNHTTIENPSLVIFRNNEFEIAPNDIFRNNRISSIFNDELNNLWISTLNGLYQFTSNYTYQEYESENTFTSRCSADIIIPNENSIWCVGFGINHYFNNNWTTNRIEDRLADNDFESAAMDTNGYLWVGTRGSGSIYKFDGEKFTDYGIPNHSNSRYRYIWAVDASPDGKIWVTASGGVAFFDGHGFQSIAINDPDFGDVRAVHAAHNGNVWIGGYDHENGAKIARLSNNEWTYYHKNEGLDAGDYVFAIDSSPTGIIYAGTRNGLFRYVNNRWEKIEGPRYINDIAFENDGSVWVVTEFSGVQHYKSGEWVNTFTILDGLPGLRMKTIAISPGGSIWVGGNGGVVKITPNE